MSESSLALRSVFSKNRTEELGYDVWKHFVVPPFYDRLDLEEAKKPRIIVGGRGCGKTMLLRYLSHQSAFSSRRRDIPPEAILHIGLYWRVDTQFAKVMNGRGLPDDVWVSAFDHLLALVLGIETLRSLESISTSSLVEMSEIAGLNFRRLAPFDSVFATGYSEFLENLEIALANFEMWVANVRKIAEPVFLPGRRFILAMIREIQRQIPKLEASVFFAYLDEFENLFEYQQRLINTCVKHSEGPLIFHLAMKRNGFATTRTLGEESINDIADFRTHDLEQYILEGDFPLFAAEVLLHNLSLADLAGSPAPQINLRDPGLVAARRAPGYREEVLGRVRKMFPGLSHEELADTVFKDEVLRKKLIRKIELALKWRGSGLQADQFIFPELPQATIIVPALLSRKNLQPEDTLQELEQLHSGQESRFLGTTQWIHNNFIGSLLALYESQPRSCPFYAGFDTFCLLARGNMRHFLELCHKSLNQSSRESPKDPWVVAPSDQARAARQVSADFLGEIRSFGRLGNKLHTFVLRLGSLFALAQSRPSQSEPEQCHFAVVRGRVIDDEDAQFLREAVKWSVLFEEEATKVKDDFEPASFEYVLNPIYSPYFHITYRKRRRLEITGDELHTLIGGSYESVKSLLRGYSEKWEVKLPDANQMLFTHLFEEGP